MRSSDNLYRNCKELFQSNCHQNSVRARRRFHTPCCYRVPPRFRRNRSFHTAYRSRQKPSGLLASTRHWERRRKPQSVLYWTCPIALHRLTDIKACARHADFTTTPQCPKYIARNCGIFAKFLREYSLFLRNSDCMAEGEEFEPSVRFVRRKLRRSRNLRWVKNLRRKNWLSPTHLRSGSPAT